ncbi:MAG: hypothetical protein N2C12_07160 [Planctomycetales bacterium]
MKNKRRHELQTNVLADWLGNKLGVIRPYTSWLLGLLIVALAVLILFSIRDNRLSNESTDGWTSLEAAKANASNAIFTNDQLAIKNALRDLQEISREYQGSSLSDYAEISLGKYHLLAGQSIYGTNKIAAKDEFKDAARHYEACIQQTSSAEVKNLAIFSLAKSLEWQQKFDQAKETYRKVSGTLAREAQFRVHDLERKSTQTFYDKFAEWKPKPQSLSERYPGFNLESGPSPSEGEIDYDQYFNSTINETILQDSTSAAKDGAAAAEIPEAGSGSRKPDADPPGTSGKVEDGSSPKTESPGK